VKGSAEQIFLQQRRVCGKDQLAVLVDNMAFVAKDFVVVHMFVEENQEEKKEEAIEIDSRL
jgi:hypothetical protein